MAGDYSKIVVTAGMPWNRSYTLFEDVGQEDPMDVTDFTAIMQFKDRPMGTTLVRLNSEDNPSELVLTANKLNVTLLPVTTAALSYGIYEIVLKHKSIANFVVPIRRGLIEVHKAVLSLT